MLPVQLSAYISQTPMHDQSDDVNDISDFSWGLKMLKSESPVPRSCSLTV